MQNSIELGVEVVDRPETIEGPDGEPIKISRLLTVGIEKFQSPSPAHYRLIWIKGHQAWLAKEDETRYRKKFGIEGSAELAGQALAEKYGVRFSAVAR
ncbi:MAG: hypothetical protein KDJ65_01595 [Anaerolineae bacterium]|nr:hypothetical protein [Anaerolineae bacterium]